MYLCHQFLFLDYPQTKTQLLCGAFDKDKSCIKWDGARQKIGFLQYGISVVISSKVATFQTLCN